MGILDKIKGFLKAQASKPVIIGKVTGGDFPNYLVLLARGDEGNKVFLKAYDGRPDVDLNKNIVKEFTTLQNGAVWRSGDKSVIGNRYKIVFNDGKGVIINVANNHTGEIEGIFLF
ncbi:MAG: hypothetical protein IJC72_03415 [Clostridia bacterium]|nr:hypothetical protein [Clostridia bacterium]